jgi:glycosidase
VTLTFSNQQPAPHTVLKRRTGESVTVQITVHSTEPIHSHELIVELWSAIHDTHGAQQAATVLRYLRSEGSAHIFGATITLPHSGHFPFTFRARHVTQPLWQWAEGSSTGTATLWVDPAWIYDAIVYNAFIRYFGAHHVESDGQIKTIEPGTFKDLREELNHLKKMGINVLYLNPVHLIGELYRNYNPHDLLPEYLQPGCPYSVKDYKSIDPELSFGSERTSTAEHPFDEFRQFVHAAHKHGMRVVMDLVFNHAAHDAVFQRLHPEWFLYKEDFCSLEQPYIYPEDLKDGKPWGDPKHTFSPYDHGWWWRDAAQLNWNNLESYPDFIMPTIAANKPPNNPTIKEMYTYFKNIVKFWIRDFGIDGFRCDVAYRVPLDFWQECIIEARATAKEAHAHNGSIDGDVVFIAEDYHVAMNDLYKAGFTACYGDYSNKLATLPEITGYLDYMYNISGDHFPQNSLWFIFPECHDFHRNPSKLVHDQREHHADADLNANKSRWTITACLPGIPMIFNGFEKIEWEPASLFSYSTIDWESDKDISDHIKAVNLIRRKEPALQTGQYHYLHTSEGIAPQSKIFSFARLQGADSIIVIVNLHLTQKADNVTVSLIDELGIDFTKPYVLVDLLTKKKYPRTGRDVTVILEPGEAHIFRIEHR